MINHRFRTGPCPECGHGGPHIVDPETVECTRCGAIWSEVTMENPTSKEGIGSIQAEVKALKIIVSDLRSTCTHQDRQIIELIQIADGMRNTIVDQNRRIAELERLVPRSLA